MPREKTPIAGKTPVRRRTVKSNGTPAETPDATAERRPSTTAASPASRSGFSEDELEQIRRRAYELYEQRGGQDGSDQDDWYRAEQEVRNRRRSA